MAPAVSYNGTRVLRLFVDVRYVLYIWLNINITPSALGTVFV